MDYSSLTAGCVPVDSRNIHAYAKTLNRKESKPSDKLRRPPTLELINRSIRKRDKPIMTYIYRIMSAVFSFEESLLVSYAHCVCVCRCGYLYIHIRTPLPNPHIRPHTHTHTPAHPHTQPHNHTPTHPDNHTPTHLLTRTSAHPHIHTPAHTRTRTHTPGKQDGSGIKDVSFGIEVMSSFVAAFDFF